MSPGLGARLPTMDHGSDKAVLSCELHGRVDLAVVDALARLVLVARRRGLRCELRTTDDGLLRLTGLDTVLLEPLRQPEAGEQAASLEEVVQVDDPPA